MDNTLPKAHIAPEDRSSQKEIDHPAIDFFSGYISYVSERVCCVATVNFKFWGCQLELWQNDMGVSKNNGTPQNHPF